MGSCSDYLVKLIKDSDPGEALQDSFIVKQLVLGLSDIKKHKILKNIYKERYAHAALFISNEDNDHFDDKGIILEYGKYEYNANEKKPIRYIYEDGGMRFGWVKLKDFQRDLADIATVNLELNQPFILFRDLIEKLKKDEDWDLASFAAFEHNCQHFCAKAIKILKAKYNNNSIVIRDNSSIGKGKKTDILPKPIRDALLNSS